LGVRKRGREVGCLKWRERVTCSHGRSLKTSTIARMAAA
jgi:hypothetical protein